MSLIVENGTGLSTAESYVSTTDAGTYCTARGLTFDLSGGPQIALAEQALRRATTWIDSTYGPLFVGAYRVSLTQALVFPLVGLVDAFGYIVASTSVPRQIVSATIEAAVRELAVPGSLSPDVVPGQIAKRLKAGSVEVEYVSGTGGASGQVPVLTVIDGILASLIPGGARNSYSGKAVRG